MRLQIVVSAIEEKLGVLTEQREKAQPVLRGEAGHLWRNDMSMETENELTETRQRVEERVSQVEERVCAKALRQESSTQEGHLKPM